MSRAAGDPGESIPSLVLLSQMQAGDTSARDELIRRYWPRLERWARGRLPAGARDLYETADVVQETMVAVLSRLSEFAPEHGDALPAYFRAAILNRLRNLADRARRRGPTVALQGEVAGAGPSPLEEAVGREAIDRYEAALARMRRDDREAIQLRIELHLDYTDVARELRKPSVAAARMAVSRALYRLAREMRRGA